MRFSFTKNPYRIAPSILSADFARLGEEVEAVINSGADIIHFDVMDNHYVPNLSVGSSVCQSLRNYGIQAPLDVHLMIKPVDRIIPDFAKAGATSISFHPEASEHADRTLQLIKDQGCQAGLALNPATPLNVLDHVMDRLDFVLVMSVNPGFGGQSFIESSLEKIKQLKQLTKQRKHPISIAVDGGVNQQNIATIARAGADTFIVGSAIFNSTDYAETIANLHQELSM